jgi:4-amino-4-deoxy-L-arabinose transferase-like glycosyltransferase
MVTSFATGSSRFPAWQRKVNSTAENIDVEALDEKKSSTSSHMGVATDQPKRKGSQITHFLIQYSSVLYFSNRFGREGMKIKSLLFQRLAIALLVVWFLLLSISFFINSPIAIFSLLPDILLLLVIVLAAFSIGSYFLEIFRIDQILPTEEFVISTALGLGGLSIFGILLSVLGILAWWSVAAGLVVFIAIGFLRIISLMNSPSYLFGPEDLSEEAPSPLSWAQYIIIAIWVLALVHFALLPPVTDLSLSTSLGHPSQWLISGGIGPESAPTPDQVNMTTALYALALALKGPHLAMLLSALVGGLTITLLYAGTKRYCGPLAARSAFLVASTIPIFFYSFLAPGDGMMMALYQFSAFFAMLRWFDERKRRWALTSGVLLGLSITVSSVAFIFVTVMLVFAFYWAFNQKKGNKFALHLVIAAGAGFLVQIPWMAVHTYLFGNPVAQLSSLLNINPLPLDQWFNDVIAVTLQLSFPSASEPLWWIMGPIFVVFVPFYFIVARKNPMSKLAISIGLVTLAISKPLGIPMELRMISSILLAIPVGLTAHRLVEKGWRKILVLSMLYFLIFGHVFFSTAIIEEVFASPHRFLLGLENRDEYLERTVDYYPTAKLVNRLLPQDAHILSIGESGLVYFERRITVAEGELLSDVTAWLSDSEDLEKGISRLQNRNYSHLMIKRQQSEPLLEISTELEQFLIFETGEHSLYNLNIGNR